MKVAFMGHILGKGDPSGGQPAELPKPRAAARPPEQQAAAERVNILIVDDRPENLVTLSAILDLPDLAVQQARSGKEALRCLLRDEFAAILLDVNMPVMDGFETARLIRQRPASAHTPIIFVTAFSDESLVHRGYSLGAVDYILTPVQPDVLRAKVGVIVELFRKTREIQRQAERLRELEAQRHRQELNATTERLRLALNAGRMGTWEWDLGRSLLSWSPTLEEIFGLTPGQFSGSVDDLKAMIYPADRDSVIQTMLSAARTSVEFRMEHRIVRPNGEVAWVEIRGKVLPREPGDPLRMGGVCMDITERKRGQDELATHRDRLEELVAERTEELRASHDRLRRSERLASLGTLAAGIAHEINNPVNAILLAAQYALECDGDFTDAGDAPAADGQKQAAGGKPGGSVATGLPTSTRETLESIVKEARRCGNIVKNVLRFAREEQTPKSLQPLPPVLRRAAILARTYVQASNLHVEVQTSDDLPLLLLNATQIEQVLINLIQNAVQASDGRIHVRLRTERETRHVRVLVTDDGRGIPEERLLYIFDPFYSTRQNQGGTGLGLSIAHGIITDHGGTIDVRSTPGKGTTFTLQFPIPANVPASTSASA